ncbi:MAG: glycosyltransferase family 4 protein [Armatimonadota bacterium]
MRNPRILEAITPSAIGGAEVFVKDLCLELERHGADVILWCPNNRAFVSYSQKAGITPHTWKTFGKVDPLTLLRLISFIRREQIDVIHTHLSTASLLGAIAARLARIRSVAHVHGLNSAKCFRYSSRIIAVSDAARRHMLVQGIRDEKITVIHDGIRLECYQPVERGEARARLGYDPQVPLFGVFGRLSPEKGQRVAIEALFLVRKDLPSARLVLAGRGPDLESLQTCAEALGVADAVHFTGFVEDVRTLMCACDAVAMPSLCEGFGLAAVEAMALCKPVVASAVGGLPEIVIQGETGILVAPNDPNDLAQALIEITTDSALRDKLARNARARVEANFDLTKQSKLILDVLTAGAD